MSAAHMKLQPPSMGKNWAVWNVPTPSIRVATKCAASLGWQSFRIGS
jgi:hypothetical protein